MLTAPPHLRAQILFYTVNGLNDVVRALHLAHGECWARGKGRRFCCKRCE